MYLSIEDRLTRADVAIGNALTDPELSGPLAEFGYDDSRLSEGRSLTDAARTLYRSQSKEYGEKEDATADLDAARDRANRTYIRYLELARLVLGDVRGAATSLQLIGSRKKSLSGWLEQAGTFYSNALSSPAVMEALARYNVTEDKLVEGQRLVQAVADLNQSQSKSKGAAEKQTADRNDAIDALDDWMSEFRAVSRIVFVDDPQQLEKLQITAPS